MKKGMLAILVGLMLLSTQAFAAQSVTLYGDDNYAPYSYLDGGKAAGIYIDILKKADSMMPDYEFVYEMQPWKRVLKVIEKGKALAGFPPYYRPELRPWIDPYSEKLLEEAVVVFCRDGVGPKPNWPADYKGVSVGFNEGFAMGETAKKAGVNVSYAESNEKNVMLLANKRIDCYVNDRFAVLDTLAGLKAKGKYKDGKHAKFMETATATQEFGHLGFSRDANMPYKADFIAKFNEVIKQMKANGDIDAIVQKYSK